jgi:arylsulfatase A-like enzyme
MAAAQRNQYSNPNAPNIVFVLVDDWGWNDVGWRSSYMDWTTPHIDRLASEGIKLENYYSAYYCIPARTSLLTGRYPVRSGTWDNSFESAEHLPHELPVDETTIANELQTWGYQTYMVGKWHVGFSTALHQPLSRGFDSFYGFLTGKVNYWTKESDYDGYLDLYDGDALVTNPEEISADYHNSFLLQDKAEEVIRSHAEAQSGRPMFLYYSMQMIHSSVSAPQTYLNRCMSSTAAAAASSSSSGASTDDGGSEGDDTLEYQRNYCAMNVMLDEAVANLTCALNKYGFGDNTYLIVASDNGGDKTGLGSSYPFKGQKGSAWNGGVAATAFIHSKLLNDDVKGSSYHGLMHVTDWMPTLMNLASGNQWSGSPLSGKEIDGLDMWPSLGARAGTGTGTGAASSQSPSPRSEILHYHDGTGSVIQIGDYKMLTSIKDTKSFDPAYVFAEDSLPAASAVQCANPSLVYGSSSSGAGSLLLLLALQPTSFGVPQGVFVLLVAALALFTLRQLLLTIRHKTRTHSRSSKSTQLYVDEEVEEGTSSSAGVEYGACAENVALI